MRDNSVESVDHKLCPLTTAEQFRQRLKNASRFNLITAVTRDCVLRCQYCYAIDPENLPPRQILSLDLLEKLINDAFDVHQEEICFEWTGGEALLAGQPFYEKAFFFQKKYARNGKRYFNVIQTSGAIYQESYYDFLIDHGVQLSLTLDGPQDLHEYHRPTKSGGSSFETALKSFEYIKKKQGSCGVVCTLTQHSLNRAQNILDFYRSKGIKNWHSNAYIHDFDKPIQNESIALTPDMYACYFKNQFDYWISLDNSDIQPGLLNLIMKCLAGIQQPGLCTHSGMCLTNFIHIDAVGNTTICPKFVGYKKVQLGNIRDSSINELLSSTNPQMKRFLEQRLESVNGCEKAVCRYISVCNSGCPYDSFLSGTEGSIAPRDRMCTGKRELYRHIDETLHHFGVTTVTNASQRTLTQGGMYEKQESPVSRDD